MGDREKVSMAGALRNLYGEKQGTADVNVQRHIQRQQLTTHAHTSNEGWASAVKTRMARGGDTEREKRRRSKGSYKTIQRKRAKTTSGLQH